MGIASPRGKFVRLPIQSEADAFRLTCGLAVAVGVAVLVGYFAGVVGGIVLFALAAAAALLRVLATGPPDRRGPLTAAERDGPERDGAGRRRALVVANEAVGDPALWDQMQGEGDAPPAIE